MKKEIESMSNPIIKRVKSLNSKKGRKESKRFIVEGKNSVLETPPCLIDFYVISRSFLKNNRSFAVSDEKDAYIVKDSMFEALTDSKSPQGILCVAHMLDFNISSILTDEPPAAISPHLSAGKGSELRLDRKDETSASKKALYNTGKQGIYIYCDNIKDPGNLGTIIRTADAFNMDGVIISPECADIYSPKVVRGTMGSIFHIPIYEGCDILSIKEELKRCGYKIYVSCLDKESKSATSIEKGNKKIIVLGSEAFGASDDILKSADFKIYIDIKGKAESLNVAVAGGIIMYECSK